VAMAIPRDQLKDTVSHRNDLLKIHTNC